MVVGEIAEDADLLVAGGGPGGYSAALRAAQLGRTVTVVDKAGVDGLGGVCVHEGCIPSKALLEVAHQFELAGRAVGGVSVVSPTFEMQGFQTWKNMIVSDIATAIRKQLDHNAVRIVKGELRFNRSNQAIVVSAEGPANYLRFKDVIIATGSRPVPLPSLPFDGELILDSADVLALSELPSAIAIVGAGYVGVELGTALAKLGCEVHLVDVAGSVLPGFDRTLTRFVSKRLELLGIELHLHAEAVDFDGAELTLESEAGTDRLAVEKVVVAIGRQPNTDNLGLETLGVTVTASGLLDVAPDRRIRPNVAAIGDVTPGPALAHKATAEAMVAVDALCGSGASFSPAAIPLVVFSDPEVATVGVTEAEAQAMGIDPLVVRTPMRSSGRALTLEARDGSVQLVFDRDRDLLVGVQVVGAHASELICEGAIAIEMMASSDDLADAVHPHPTLGELYGDAARLASRLLART